MWTLVIICLIGMIMFFASACTIALVYKDIEKRLRITIGITSITMIFGIVSLLLVTTLLDQTRKEKDMLYKKMKQQEKYELIQEPVYRKIK